MIRLATITLLAVSMLSCGGGGSGSCGKVEPCGGAVVGTWKAGPTCANNAFITMSFEQGLMDTCPTATVGGIRVSQSGTVTLGADLSYSASIVDDTSVSFTIPASCNTSGASCSVLAAYLQESVSGGTASCTGLGGCTCTLSMSQPQSDTGTYSISGNSITINSATNGSTGTEDYCVQGNTLHLLQVDTTTNMGPMGQATIDTDETFTRQ